MRCWVGDRLVDVDEAHVSVFDHGFTVADGVFETLRVDAGVPFALSLHLRRLAASASGLGIPAPEDDLVRHAVAATLADAPEPVTSAGRLRITVTSGSGPMGSGRGTATPTLVVTLAAATRWPATASVVTVGWTRNERSAIAGLKTTSYAENVVALARARARGADEALLANTRGELCEGTGSNVFVVIDGAVLTPPLTSGCLGGITRELVLRWCGGIERALAFDVLGRAEEIFLTSSTRDVHPVSMMDDRELVAPGPVTARVAEEFARRAAADPDPPHGPDGA